VSEVTHNYIVVDGVEVSAGGIFQPLRIEVGERVAVTGVYENNGMLRATSIEYLDDEELQDDDDLPVADCVADSHPIVRTLAGEFGVEVGDLINLHCSGYGFGDIARALLIVEQAGGDVASYLLDYDQGQDWGAIAREAGLEPGAVSPNRIIGNKYQG
jgi:hypothetical protein